MALPLRRGRKEQYEEYLRSPTWLAKWDAALARDGRRCQVKDCGVSRGLHVHHLRYPRVFGKEPLSWLVTLCAKHHRRAHDLGATATFVVLLPEATREDMTEPAKARRRRRRVGKSFAKKKWQ